MPKNKSKKARKGYLQLLRVRTTFLIFILLIGGFGAAISRLAYLQTVQSPYLHEKAVDQQLKDTTLTAKRGTIYDAKGKVLAKSASVWQVVIAPAYFDNDSQRRYVAKNLAKILDLKYKDVFEKTKLNTYYSVVKRKIETPEREKILKLVEKINKKYKSKLANVIVLLDDYKRYYPYGELAASVIGFTGSDDQGLEGVEYKYNDYLAGTPGRVISANNMPFDYKQSDEAQNGNNITLTIDETIQAIAEKYMKQGLADNKVTNRGVCIIMNVKTGAILAMVTVDGYDLNDPYKLPKSDLKAIKSLPDEERLAAESAALSAMWRNKAISDTYYPGSVFKICTASMALNEGLVNDNTSFFCSGSYQLYNNNIGCHKRSGHGAQNFFEAICNSCNPAFINIGNMIGATEFRNYYKGFGFSEITGIDLPGESEDIFFGDPMSETDLAVGSFGQGFSITPIQMITACAAVCNGGYVLQPYVVQSISDENGNVIKNTETVVKRQVISEETSKKMCDYLERNTMQGGTHNGYIPGYRVGGKTGTSEKLTSSLGSEDYIASYCGFAPADDPEVACLVFYDTPKGDAYYGSQVSAPVFVNIMSEVLPYLELQAEYTDDEAQYLDTLAGSYVGLSVEKATAEAKQDGFTVTVKGEGKKVISQIPASSAKIPKDGNVVLYTDEQSASNLITVPNLVGYSVSDVNYVASSHGLNISMTGITSSASAISLTQSIAEGTQVQEGTVISIKFGESEVLSD